MNMNIPTQVETPSLSLVVEPIEAYQGDYLCYWVDDCLVMIELDDIVLSLE